MIGLDNRPVELPQQIHRRVARIIGSNARPRRIVRNGRKPPAPRESGADHNNPAHHDSAFCSARSHDSAHVILCVRQSVPPGYRPARGSRNKRGVAHEHVKTTTRVCDTGNHAILPMKIQPRKVESARSMCVPRISAAGENAVTARVKDCTSPEPPVSPEDSTVESLPRAPTLRSAIINPALDQGLADNGAYAECSPAPAKRSPVAYGSGLIATTPYGNRSVRYHWRQSQLRRPATMS